MDSPDSERPSSKEALPEIDFSRAIESSPLESSAQLSAPSDSEHSGSKDVHSVLDASQGEDSEQPASSKMLDEIYADTHLTGAKPFAAPKREPLPEKIELLQSGKPKIDGDPKVVMLDDYRYLSVHLNYDKGFSHGELSARMLEEQGMNVDRYQIGFRNSDGQFDVGGSLRQINEGIENGTIDLGKGDVINLSFAMEVRFDAASDFLGLELTPENLKENRQAILDAVERKLQERESSYLPHQNLKDILDTSEQITALQEKGIKVVAGGGNEGPDHFNIEMIMADEQYSATDRNGELAEFSVDNSLTIPHQGVFDIYYQSVDVLNPTSIAEQSGFYTVDGLDVELDAGEFNGPRLHFDASELRVRNLMEPVDPGSLKYSFHLGDDHSAPSHGLSEVPTFEEYSSTPGEEQKLTILKSRSEPIPDFKTWRRGRMVTSAQGTSFSNTSALPKQLDELRREKNT